MLASIEEEIGPVCIEAMAGGSVSFVSDVRTGICWHMEKALVHSVGDVKTLAKQITKLYEDRSLLVKLRTESLRTRNEFTWGAA